MDIENYSVIHCVRLERMGGGVLLYLHNNVKLIKQVSSPFNESIESCCAEIMFQQRVTFLCEFYRIPNSDDRLFMPGLKQILNISNHYKTAIMCSDQNYDLLKLQSHRYTQEFISQMQDCKFISTMLKPTRVTHSTATLIDNIYVKNKSINRHKSFIIVDGMSDHYPCLLNYEFLDKRRNTDETVIEKHKLNEDNIFKIQHSLLHHDWQPLCDLNVNDAYDYLISVITGKLDEFCPKQLIKLRNCDKFREPWMTVKIKRFNQKCRKLCNKAHLSGLKKDIIAYKQYRSILNKIKNFEKKEHYESLFRKIGKNSSLLWNVVNNILRKTNNCNEITELSYCGTRISDSQGMANAFNEHFVNAGRKVRDSIPHINSNKNPLDYVKSVTNCLLFSPVSEQYICKIVSSLKSK